MFLQEHRSSFQHPYGNLQLSVTSFLKISCPILASMDIRHTHGTHIYIKGNYAFFFFLVMSPAFYFSCSFSSHQFSLTIDIHILIKFGRFYSNTLGKKNNHNSMRYHQKIFQNSYNTFQYTQFIHLSKSRNQGYQIQKRHF